MVGECSHLISLPTEYTHWHAGFYVSVGLVTPEDTLASFADWYWGLSGLRAFRPQRQFPAEPLFAG